jgi:RimJ/RimL family protein N-acetyltransferase
MTIGFRRLTGEDLRVLHEWLQREHVKRWWSKHETYDDVVAHYLPALEGREPTDLYVILLDGEAAGFIQTYLVRDYPDYQRLVEVEDGVAGVDLFLADERATGRGIGSEALHRFVQDVVFSGAVATHACVADPDAENVGSLRAFEKAGFAAVRTFVDPADGRLHTLVRAERQGESRWRVQPPASRS